MGARLKIEPHLTQDEIRGYFLTSEDGVEQMRWQVILLLSEGVKSEEVARIVGYCVPWVREIAGATIRKVRPPCATAGMRIPAQRGCWRRRCSRSLRPPWSSRRGRRDVERPAGSGLDGRRLGQKVHAQRGWDYMRRVGFTPQRPRPKHPEGNPATQESFPAGAAATLG